MPAQGRDENETPTSSGTSTPANLSSSWSVPGVPPSLTSAMSGLLRRFSSEPNGPIHSPTFPPMKGSVRSGVDGVYTPPYRTASPFQPPPLTSINLKGFLSTTSESAQLLTRTLAEEIRLLVPIRLQLCEDWNLVYSLDQNGVSLGTLYKKCEDLRGKRNGYVLVVRDGDGGVCPSCTCFTEFVLIGHSFSVRTYPMHLILVPITLGQENVFSGEPQYFRQYQWATYPHLHLQTQQTCNAVPQLGFPNLLTISLQPSKSRILLVLRPHHQPRQVSAQVLQLLNAYVSKRSLIAAIMNI